MNMEWTIEHAMNMQMQWTFTTRTHSLKLVFLISIFC